MPLFDALSIPYKIGVGEILIGEHQDHVFEKRPMHFIEPCVVEVALICCTKKADR